MPVHRSLPILAAALLLVAAACGQRAGTPYAGTWVAEIRPLEGAEEAEARGERLTAIRRELLDRPQILDIRPGGRYTLNIGPEVREGEWRIEGDRLILTDDAIEEARPPGVAPEADDEAPVGDADVVRIQPGERRYRIDLRLGQEELVDTESYTEYGLEMAYKKR
jgi:hypothetical protein